MSPDDVEPVVTVQVEPSSAKRSPFADARASVRTNPESKVNSKLLFTEAGSYVREASVASCSGGVGFLSIPLLPSPSGIAAVTPAIESEISIRKVIIKAEKRLFMSGWEFLNLYEAKGFDIGYLHTSRVKIIHFGLKHFIFMFFGCFNILLHRLFDKQRGLWLKIDAF